MRWLFACVVWIVCLGLFACSGEKVTPLPEPLFRLSTTVQPKDCNPTVGNPPCRWEVVGLVYKAEVTESNDNPFQNCTNCVFSHKITVLDGDGAFHHLYYKLPNDGVIPVTINDGVKLTYIKGDHANKGFAVSLRNQNDVLIAAIASGPGGALLDGLLGEFSVVVDLNQEAGREVSDCGTKIFRYMVFKTKAGSEQLAPGKTAKVSNSIGSSFFVGNVNRYNWENSKCQNLRNTPHSFFIHLTY